MAAQRVESHDADVGRPSAELARHLRPYSAGRFGGEAQHQDGRGIQAALLNKEGNTAGERRGLPAARTGSNCQRPVSRGNCLQLCR
jgi:hypothetical protein